MSYSNINDAFNINSDFENTIRGLNSFNPVNNTMENIRNSYDYDLNNSKSEYESNYFGNNKKQGNTSYEPNFDNYYNPNNPVPYIDGMFTNDNLSWESLNGTDLLSRDNGDLNLKMINQNNQNKNNKSNKNDNCGNNQRKLTHRECVKIYNNPDSYKDTTLSQALKHVSKCQLCKDELKKTLGTQQNKQSSNSKNQNKTSLAELEQKTSVYDNKSNLSEDNSQNRLKKKSTQSDCKDNESNREILSNLSKTKQLDLAGLKIESELKMLNEKIGGESNLRYQNAMLQNNLSKYLEDLEEKKKINYKLDKIIELVNVNLTQSNKLVNSEKNYAGYQEQNIMNQLNPQILAGLTNLSKLTQSNMFGGVNGLQSTQLNQTTSTETYVLYVVVIIFIILLVVDIVLRFTSSKNQ
jgi:hypothetical protein